MNKPEHRSRVAPALWPVAALALASALAACGGNDDYAPTPPPSPPVAEDPIMVPASATANAAAFSSYAANLAPSDTTEPLVVGTLVPPVSDTEEPVALTR